MRTARRGQGEEQDKGGGAKTRMRKSWSLPTRLVGEGCDGHTRPPARGLAGDTRDSGSGSPPLPPAAARFHSARDASARGWEDDMGTLGTATEPQLSLPRNLP